MNKPGPVHIPDPIHIGDDHVDATRVMAWKRWTDPISSDTCLTITLEGGALFDIRAPRGDATKITRWETALSDAWKAARYGDTWKEARYGQNSGSIDT